MGTKLRIDKVVSEYNESKRSFEALHYSSQPYCKPIYLIRITTKPFCFTNTHSLHPKMYSSLARNLIFPSTATSSNSSSLNPHRLPRQDYAHSNTPHIKKTLSVKTTRVQPWLINKVRILHFHCKFKLSTKGSQYHCSTNFFSTGILVKVNVNYLHVYLNYLHM